MSHTSISTPTRDARDPRTNGGAPDARPPLLPPLPLTPVSASRWPHQAGAPRARALCSSCLNMWTSCGACTRSTRRKPGSIVQPTRQSGRAESTPLASAAAWPTERRA
eukprot:6202988-Pleurochrysis_carterae.AAC.2